MRPFLVRGSGGLKGKITLSGDKSIAHRAIIISALTRGKTVISNFPANQDSLATLNALKKFGLKIIRNNSGTVTVFGKGLHGLTRPKGPIFVGESGTTLRLLLGVLAAQNFSTKLIAGKSLSKRPMLRVNLPLRLMGAKISAKRKTQNAKPEEYPPVTIKGGSLNPITYRMPVASAQVKSAILLAGLYACGKTRVIEPISTRDHTERMLKVFKAGIRVNPSTALCFDKLSIRPERVKRVEGLRVDSERSSTALGTSPEFIEGRSRTIKQNNIVIKGGRELVSPGRIYIPGDISSASFFIVGAAILPDSRLLIKNVSLNPSRIGIINVLKRMGANIRLTAYSLQLTAYESAGDILIKSSKLKGAVVKKKEIPSLIDELPILMVAACLAKGKTVFEGVRELRVKETDRIRSMQENLTRMGAYIRVERDARGPENIVIEGGKKLNGAKVRSFFDHRTAMSMVIAGLAASGTTSIDNLDCINKSFPDFLALLKPLLH